jgi:hypothetical protein
MAPAFRYLAMMKDQKLGALAPGDELFRDMPRHVQDVYRRAKAFRRHADRRRFADRSPAGLESPDSLTDFLR